MHHHSIDAGVEFVGTGHPYGSNPSGDKGTRVLLAVGNDRDLSEVDVIPGENDLMHRSIVDNLDRKPGILSIDICARQLGRSCLQGLGEQSDAPQDITDGTHTRAFDLIEQHDRIAPFRLKLPHHSWKLIYGTHRLTHT